MGKYEFKATNLIAEAFEKRGVKFGVINHHVLEDLQAGFGINCGPTVMLHFISKDNDNDVAVRILGLISNVPKEKRLRVMEACNTLNEKIRHTKFYIDSKGNVNVEYDFPQHTPDNGVGEVAFEMFIRMMRILDAEYSIFMKALYSDAEINTPQPSQSNELMQKLDLLRRMMQAQGSSDITIATEIDDEDTIR